jgi:uncharacterized Tic20 family protein/Zn-finger nucleic acid-binding protein
MPIEVACPACDAKLKAPDALAGKIVKCPRCSEKILVERPAPSAAVATVPKPRPMNLSIEERDEPENNDYQQEPENNQGLDELDELPEVEDQQVADDDEVDEVLAADDDEDEVDDRYAEDDDRPRKPKKKKKKRRGGAPDKDECTMAMLIYLLGIVTHFIGPLILWLMKREESKFIDHHGKNALNFAITLFLSSLILGAVGIPLAFMTFGLGAFLVVPLQMALGIYGLVMYIIAAVKANKGEWYEMPITFTFFK